MSSDVYLTTQHEFKGEEYLVTARVTSPFHSGSESGEHVSELLVVEVENVSTCEQWSSEFTPQYVEELTSKTGNYKPFLTFTHMLQVALEKKSSTVNLDLLTLADLEQLRRQKGGSFVSLGKTLHTSSRRYLILTYNVEFDRIHYPLVLHSSGVLDPIKLLASLRDLQRETAASKQGRKHAKDPEFTRLKKKYDDLLFEKEDIEQKLLTAQDQARFVEKGPNSKKTEVLKSVIRTLESDLVQERTKYQRYVNQKRDALRDMQDELEELRTSEGTLRTRVKYLTNELAMYKRGQSHGTFQPRSVKTDCKPSLERGRSLSPKPRSLPAKPRHTDNARGALLDTPTSRKATPKAPLSGTRKPRFDPTAYIRERAEKQQEAARRRGRSLSRSPSPRGRSGTRSRSHSADSYSGRRPSDSGQSAPAYQSRVSSQRAGGHGSRNSSLERRSSSLERLGKPTSARSIPAHARPPPSGGHGRKAAGKHPQSSWNSSPATSSKKQVRSKQHGPRALNDSPDEDDSLRYDETRIADINARLSHLRTFMQASFPKGH